MCYPALHNVPSLPTQAFRLKLNNSCAAPAARIPVAAEPCTESTAKLLESSKPCRQSSFRAPSTAADRRPRDLDIAMLAPRSCGTLAQRLLLRRAVSLSTRRRAVTDGTRVEDLGRRIPASWAGSAGRDCQPAAFGPLSACCLRARSLLPLRPPSLVRRPGPTPGPGQFEQVHQAHERQRASLGDVPPPSFRLPCS
jgi:hypothetical protein